VTVLIIGAGSQKLSGNFFLEQRMISNYLENIKGLIIDMDGVLWRDTQPIGDLPLIFDRINELGLKAILATNNSTKTVQEYIKKLSSFGVDLESWQVINSAQAAGIYLQKNYPKGTKVYVVGQQSLMDTLESYGLSVVDDGVDGIEIVVASLDLELTYEKLKKASLLIQSGCDFIGTNPDATFPTPSGLIPGSGTVVGALEIASGKKANIMGKPQPYLYQMALDRLALKPEETLAIGDRLETDIAGGQAAGVHTALVLSGVSTMAQVKSFKIKPEIITNDLYDLVF